MEPFLGGGATASARGRHHYKAPSSDRFFGEFSSSPPSDAGVELTEDDIFDSTAEPVASTSASTNRGGHNHRSRHQQAQHNQPKHLGILAVLPASETHSVFNHKASVSSSSSSSSSSSAASSSELMIPTVSNPRKPPAFNNRAKVYHQSAPVNVPTLSAAVAEERRRRRCFDYVSEEDDVDDVKMLPPHEIVAAKPTPLLSCSVLEGAGRTLKGRDLRRVRNAVFRNTGFLD